MKRLVLIFLLVSGSLFAKVYLTATQLKTKQLILRIAPHYTKYSYTILAISMAESSLGLHVLGDDGNSIGITQLQVATIRYIAKKDKTLGFLLQYSNAQLTTFILKNDNLAVIITCKLFEYYRKKYGYFQAISRYNGGTKNIRYYNKVVNWRTKLKEK